jgi:hypothetical protein
VQVFVQQKDKDSGLSAEVKVAKLSMIDLAGSEKGCVTGNKGARFREGSNINKSLLGPPFFRGSGSGIRCLFDPGIRDG